MFPTQAENNTWLRHGCNHEGMENTTHQNKELNRRQGEIFFISLISHWVGTWRESSLMFIHRRLGSLRFPTQIHSLCLLLHLYLMPLMVIPNRSWTISVFKNECPKTMSSRAISVTKSKLPAPPFLSHSQLLSLSAGFTQRTKTLWYFLALTLHFPIYKKSCRKAVSNVTLAFSQFYTLCPW